MSSKNILEELNQINSIDKHFFGEMYLWLTKTFFDKSRQLTKEQEERCIKATTKSLLRKYVPNVKIRKIQFNKKDKIVSIKTDASELVKKEEERIKKFLSKGCGYPISVSIEEVPHSFKKVISILKELGASYKLIREIQKPEYYPSTNFQIETKDKEESTKQIKEKQDKKRKQQFYFDNLINNFFLRKTIYMGGRALKKYGGDKKIYSEKDINHTRSRIVIAYNKLQKNSRYLPLRKHCLERILKVMEEYPERSESKYYKEFIGIRAEANLDMGVIKKHEKNHDEAARYLEQAFSDLSNGIKNFCDFSIEAKFKFLKVCDEYSKLNIDEEIKKDKIKSGIKLIEESKGTDKKERPHPIFDNLLAFLHIKLGNYEKGTPLIKSCLKGLNPDYYNKKTLFIYSFAGSAFSDAYRANEKEEKEKEIDNLKEEDLENLILAIACQELSRGYGNIEKENLQTIGREYYNLQFLIEKADRKECKNISINTIKNKIKEILSWKVENEFVKQHNIDKEVFKNYSGGLREINYLDNSIPNLGKEMQFIALKSAYRAFIESKRNGDTSLDNKSYQGTCLVNLVKLNRWLNKFDDEKAKEKLEEARILLEEVKEKREKETENNTEDKKKLEKLIKDYIRLSDCYFRLADGDITQKTDERINLYKNVIKLNEKIIEKSYEKPEPHSFIAASKYKIADLISDKEEKKKIFEELIKEDSYFDLALKLGDNSAENRNKKGSCYLKLIKLEVEDKNNSAKQTDIDNYINKARENLEEAVNKGKGGGFVYPYFLLANLSKMVMKIGKDLGCYNLKDPRDYIKSALESYSKNKSNWVIKEIEGCKNLVYEIFDNYKLLNPFFLIKKGKSKYLEQEIKNAEILNEELEKEFREDRKYYTIDPLAIISREDEEEKYYFMSRIPGCTLEKFIKDNSNNKIFDILKDIVYYLGFIHGRMPKGESGFQYEPFIENKLKQIGINENIIEVISENYSPIKSDLMQSLFVFNKDAHPRNWLIKKKDNSEEFFIYAIDLEGKRESVPAEFDLASLLENLDLKWEDKKELFGIYEDSLLTYTEHPLQFCKIFSERRYLNASFPKAISVASWQTTTKDIKLRLLTKTKENLKMIKEIDQSYYQQFSNNYEKLLKGLDEIIAKFR